MSASTLSRLCLSAVLILARSSLAATDAPPGDAAELEEVLSRLEARVSSIETLRAEFVQQKFLAALDRPLILRGTILMQKPDLFSWKVREPLRYSMVIRGEVVEQWDEDTRRVEKISLSGNPIFKMAIQQMRDWLSGAYRSMLGQYRVTVVGEDPIFLEFVPREKALAQQVIDLVRVEFDRDERYIRQIDIRETGGDRTLITFSDTLLNTPIAPEAWKVEQDVR